MLKAIIFLGLALSPCMLMLLACSGEYVSSDVESASSKAKKGVIYAFDDIVSSNVLLHRKDLYIQWSVNLGLASAEPTEYMGQWVIRVPQGDAVEEWEFNTPRLVDPYVKPLNGAALFTAILFFCTDRSDPKPSCKNLYSGC
jgi:hypothetical protein